MKAFAKTAAVVVAGAVLLLGAGQGQLVHAEAQGKWNMSYLFFGSPSSYISQVDRTNGSLNVVSPSYFNISADGSLQISETLEASFIESMRQRGVKVVPFLSNHWDRDAGIQALKNREALATRIAEAIQTYKLDGVNVDIENVTEAERDAYTELVRLLRAKLPASLEVSVAVAANPTGASKGWLGSYDYKALAEASDYLMLMAYDESYPGDPTPGPVASLSFVESSVKAALKQVPADKLVLGIPFYGRYWNQSPASNGAGVSNSLVSKLVETYKGKLYYDEQSQSPYATFTIGAGDPASSVYGTKLAPGNYTVWYENERSIKEKLKLVQKYNLKGTGSWSLNQETADTWSYYDLWLNGHTFADVQGHWAMPAVLEAANRGWLRGTAADRFAPDEALTRAEAAAIVVRALGLESETAAAGSPFRDVPAAHWARHDIAVAKQRGLIQGISSDLFAPDRAVTREEMCMLLSRVLQAPPAAGGKLAFADVPSDSWSYGAIAAVSRLGLVDGFADGTFRPGAPLTRAEMAALLQRAAPRLAP